MQGFLELLEIPYVGSGALAMNKIMARKVLQYNMAGATDEDRPARVPEAQYRQAERLALASHKALGCCGMSRVDMMASGHDICVLEVNTIPRMAPASLLPCAAEVVGIPFPDLLDRLIGFAAEGRAR